MLSIQMWTNAPGDCTAAAVTRIVLTLLGVIPADVMKVFKAIILAEVSKVQLQLRACFDLCFKPNWRPHFGS